MKIANIESLKGLTTFNLYLKTPWISLTLPFRVKTTEHTSAPSCALSNVLMQRPLIASQILIVPSKLPVEYSLAFGAYFTQVTLELCCCDEIGLTKHCAVLTS